MPILEGKRVALVHDWLTGMRGGELVLEELCHLFPGADLFTLIHVAGSCSKTIEEMNIKTSWIERLPGSPGRFRSYLPLFPSAIESFDLRGYDLVVSTSHCVAKGVIPEPGAIHVSYVFTPMRYVWDLTSEYFHPDRAGRLVRTFGPIIANHLRTWDVTSTPRVDSFVGCSGHVARRIERFYRRRADVIYPPVDTDFFTPGKGDREHLLIVSALVPYKAIELAIEAVRDSKEKLEIVGLGPERERLEQTAPGNVTFHGAVSRDRLLELYRGAKAFLLPGEEDFGIAAVEAQSCGTPVIAYGRGGALETVIDGTTGCLFPEPTPESIRKAIDRLERTAFNTDELQSHARRFSRESFVETVSRHLTSAVESRSETCPQ